MGQSKTNAHSTSLRLISAVIGVLTMLAMTGCGDPDSEPGSQAPTFDTTNTQRLLESWEGVMYELSDQDQIQVANNVVAMYQIRVGKRSAVSYNRPGSEWEWFFDPSGKAFVIEQLYDKVTNDPRYANAGLHGRTAQEILGWTQRIKAMQEEREHATRLQGSQTRETKIKQVIAAISGEIQQKRDALSVAQQSDEATQQKYKDIFANADNIKLRVTGIRIKEKKRGMIGILGDLEVVNETGLAIRQVKVGIRWLSNGNETKREGWTVRQGRGFTGDLLPHGAVATIPLRSELRASVDDVQAVTEYPAKLGITPWVTSFTVSDGTQYRMSRVRRDRDATLKQLKEPQLREEIQKLEKILALLIAGKQ
ncbi:MAG: hypothetical protein AAF542_21765 [Pseudomonadota bacterium]